MELACDGLKGLPASVGEIWPLATVQLCVAQLVRASLRFASTAQWGPITKALREVYAAPMIAAAEAPICASTTCDGLTTLAVDQATRYRAQPQTTPHRFGAAQAATTEPAAAGC